MADITRVFTREDKVKYAKALLRNPDPFQAALSAFPNETGVALWVMSNWPQDFEFQSIVEELKLDPKFVSTLVGSADEALKTLKTIYEDKKEAAKDRILAIRTMAEIKGWIAEKGTNVNVQVGSNVMVVKDLGTNEEWEKKAKEQQTNLTRRNDESVH